MAMLVAVHGMKLQRSYSVSVSITPAERAAVGVVQGTTNSPGGPAPFLLGTHVKNVIVTIKLKTVTMMKVLQIRGEV